MAADKRALLVKKGVTGADPLVDGVLSGDRELFDKATALKVSTTKRPYVEACLLATQDLGEIAALLEIDEEVLQTYADFYYDTQGLDKLSRLELLAVPDKQEGLLKIWAFSQGLDFIAWRLGHRVNISPVDGLQELFTTCIMKSKEAMFSGNASEESKEATKWVKLSLDLARLLKVWVMDTDAAKADIEMALREVIPDFEGFDSIQDDIAEPVREPVKASVETPKPVKAEKASKTVEATPDQEPLF